MANAVIWRADTILTDARTTLRDAEVITQDGVIQEVRSRTAAGHDTVRDLGNAILMPGLVNVHTHLDYTAMRGAVEDVSFFPWIRELTSRSALLTPDDWLASAVWGAAECAAGGITTIGDCTPTGNAAEAAALLGLGGVIYQELFGIDPAGQSRDIAMQELEEKLARLRRLTRGTGLHIGISPHSPYTVRNELLRATARYANRHTLPLCIHAAESLPECQLIRTGQGEIADSLRRRGINWKPTGETTVQYLDDCGLLGKRTLLVHGVQVAAADLTIAQRSGLAWAHCPRSNAKLGNGVAPLMLLGPRIGLGTDSAVSSNTLDMFEEMRFAVYMQRASRRQIEVVSANQAVGWATEGGATALGINGRTGTLRPGSSADICAVSLNSLTCQPAYDACSALVYACSARDVVVTVSGGRVIYDTSLASDAMDRFPEIDLRSWARSLEAAASRIKQWKRAE